MYLLGAVGAVLVASLVGVALVLSRRRARPMLNVVAASGAIGVPAGAAMGLASEQPRQSVLPGAVDSPLHMGNGAGEGWELNDAAKAAAALDGAAPAQNRL